MQLEIKEPAGIPVILAVLLSATLRCLTNPPRATVAENSQQRIARPAEISAYLKKRERTKKSD